MDKDIARIGAFRYVAVEKHILARIESGELPPGEKIPSLRALGSRLGLSVSTIGQAYLELERQGVIEARPKSGYFVRERPQRLPRPRRRTEVSDEPRQVSRNTLIRQVLDTMGRDDILPFGVAKTGEELLPAKTLARIMTQVVRDNPEGCLRYETVAGNEALRRQIALRCLDAGAEVTAADVLITAGALEALFIAVRSVTRAGDNVVIAAPSYYCFLQILEYLGLRAIEVPSCPQCGVNPSDLASILRKFDVKACILTPNFNNPDGAVMSERAKREIVAMLAERDIPLIEDDVYGEMHYGPKRPPLMKSFDEKGLVLTCSSFSKTLSAGYRVGWILPGRFHDRAFDFKGTTNVCTATPTQMAVAEYLSQGGFDRHLRRLQQALEKQMRTMRALVGRHFPAGTTATIPGGGSVMWIELPGGVDGGDFYFRARDMGIGVAPGAIFSTQDKFNNCIRLSYGTPLTEPYQEGVRRLGELAQAMLAEAGDATAEPGTIAPMQQ
jgi:DNA-binding transcriptional MocR family regulator